MILIVDDKKENIFALKQLLELKSYEVDTALSGEEALKKILKNTYVLIILDVQMPGMDGFEVAETISGYSKYKNVPIIFLSAVNTEKKFITKGYASGAMDYVTKPVDPDILLLKINTFYRLHEQNLKLKDIQKELKQEIEYRKQAQKELRDWAHQLRSILESLPQIAFTINNNGKIDFVNHRWFNYSLKSDKFPEVHPDDIDLKKEIQKCVDFGVELKTEVRIKHIEKSVFCYHLLRVIPIKDKHKTIKLVGTFTDIDQQKQEEHKKDEFISIASHELKTPLTSVKAYMQLLERSIEKNSNEKNKDLLKKAHLQIDKLHSLIADLLDISKLEGGKLKLNKQPFSADQMVKNAIEMIKNMHEGYEITKTGEPLNIPVTGDEIRIEQVLINYLTNAIKYAPESRKIDVETILQDNQLKISVTDFGIGIPEHAQKHVFDKFYRVDQSSVKFQGLGIGLYICAEIIEKHNGTFGFTSEVNQGSTFYFTVPIN